MSLKRCQKFYFRRGRRRPHFRRANIQKPDHRSLSSPIFFEFCIETQLPKISIFQFRFTSLFSLANCTFRYNEKFSGYNSCIKYIYLLSFLQLFDLYWFLCENGINIKLIMKLEKLKFNSYSVRIHAGLKLYNFHYLFFKSWKLERNLKYFSKPLLHEWNYSNIKTFHLTRKYFLQISNTQSSQQACINQRDKNKNRVIRFYVRNTWSNLHVQRYT